MNPWTYKPWWCQPWSILLTGISIIAGTWFLTKLIWLTAVIALPILVWMGFFLLLWPQLMRRYLESEAHPDATLNRDSSTATLPVSIKSNDGVAEDH